jgi:MmyB-like transcription regulator ligand binding domain/Helix-turn-helix domain
LRSRRARLSPAEVGLRDDGARRRTPGLRREELAALAGVGVSWYTWLEQGRDIPWFVRWWSEHEITDTQRGTKTIEHPALGTLRLHHAQTVPTGSPELRLTVYAPADAATRAALANL